MQADTERPRRGTKDIVRAFEYLCYPLANDPHVSKEHCSQRDCEKRETDYEILFNGVTSAFNVQVWLCSDCLRHLIDNHCVYPAAVYAEILVSRIGKYRTPMYERIAVYETIFDHLREAYLWR